MPRYELIKIEQLVEPEIAAREAMDTDKLNELAESVREVGFIHPLAVVLVSETQGTGEEQGKRRGSKGLRASAARYEIVDGHRRYKVGIMLEQAVLPCLVFDDPQTAREAVKLHANLFREDLSTAEEAAFIADLIEKYDYTEEQLCRAVRQKPSWVNERLTLLHGNMEVFDALRARKINFAVAKQLNRVSGAQRAAIARNQDADPSLPSLEEADAQTHYFLGLVIEGGATAVTVAKWVGDWLCKKFVPAGVQTTGPVVAQTSDSAPVGPACIFCGKVDSPYQMENVWIHGWELKMLQHQLRTAGALPVEELETPTNTNGGNQHNVQS